MGPKSGKKTVADALGYVVHGKEGRKVEKT